MHRAHRLCDLHLLKPVKQWSCCIAGPHYPAISKPSFTSWLCAIINLMTSIDSEQPLLLLLKLLHCIFTATFACYDSALVRVLSTLNSIWQNIYFLLCLLELLIWFMLLILQHSLGAMKGCSQFMLNLCSTTVVKNPLISELFHKVTVFSYHAVMLYREINMRVVYCGNYITYKGFKKENCNGASTAGFLGKSVQVWHI